MSTTTEETDYESFSLFEEDGPTRDDLFVMPLPVNDAFVACENVFCGDVVFNDSYDPNDLDSDSSITGDISLPSMSNYSKEKEEANEVEEDEDDDTEDWPAHVNKYVKNAANVEQSRESVDCKQEPVDEMETVSAVTGGQPQQLATEQHQQPLLNVAEVEHRRHLDVLNFYSSMAQSTIPNGDNAPLTPLQATMAKYMNQMKQAELMEKQEWTKNNDATPNATDKST